MKIIDDAFSSIIEDANIYKDIYSKNGYYPLHQACFHDNTKLISDFLKCGYDVNVINKNQESNDTALMTAIKNGNYKMAKFLLDNSFFVDVNILDSNKETPFIYMINHDNFINSELFKELIDHGADLLLCYKNDPPLILAIKKKKIDYIRIILRQPSIDINQLYNGKSVMDIILDDGISDEEIFNILFEKKAIIRIEYFRKELFSLVENNQGLIQSFIKNGYYMRGVEDQIIHIKTPVIYFIKYSKNDFVEKLIDSGASIEEMDDDGITPMIQAVIRINTTLFNKLLNKYHPDINKKNKLGQSLLTFVYELDRNKDNKRDDFISLLEKYIKNNNLECNIDFHDKDDVLKNIDNIEGSTEEKELLNLVKQGNIELVKNKLNNREFDINKQYYRITFLSILINNKIDDEEIYDILFKKGAFIEPIYIGNNKKYFSLIESNIGLVKSIAKNGFNIKNLVGEVIHIKTPLIYFIKRSKKEFVEKLLDHGASFDEIDEEGVTPLIQTIKTGNNKLFEALLNKYHPDINKKNELGQSVLTFVYELDESKDNKKDVFISILEKYIKDNKIQCQNNDHYSSNNNNDNNKGNNNNNNNDDNKGINNDGNINNNNNIVHDLEANSGKNKLITAIKQKNVELIKNILNDKEFDVNKLYNEMPIMSILIENKIDDEEVYNILFNKGAFIEHKYLKSLKNGSSLLVENNIGLIKSIIRNGFYTKKKNSFVHINTPLKYFIKNYSNPLVEKLLENNASIEESDENGLTPIYHTIKTNNLKLFNLLIDKYHPDIDRNNKLGQTPLAFAQQLDKNKDNNRNNFIIILENYAKNKNATYTNLKDNTNKNINKNMKEGNFKDIINEHSNINIKEGNFKDFINELNNVSIKENSAKGNINEHNSVDNIKDNTEENKLISALKEDDFETARNILDNTKNINVNCFDENKETPLIIMINKEESLNCGVFKKLIECGANLSQKYKGDIPLVLAIKNKKVGYIQLLLKYSSEDVVNKRYNGKTIMNLLIDNLIDVEQVYNTLFKKGAFIDFSYLMNSNLSLNVLIEKNSGLIKSIIKNGLIIKKRENSPTQVIKTPLIYFIKSGQNTLSGKLLENNVNIEETDEDGLTPIFYSIKCGKRNIFYILLCEYHADIFKKNKKGQTPLMYAMELEKDKGCNRELIIYELEHYKENKIVTVNGKMYRETSLMIALKQENYKIV
eukprot:jgi/Orpsp1_1/1180502/evm.model.c7180000073673.1